ncbi:MAG: GumC family protein [Hyphomicrobiaceae bacterium]
MAGGYGDSAPDGQSELALTLRYLIAVALKWHALILGTVGIFLAVGLAYVFLATPLYSAVVRIQIDKEPGKVVDHGTMTPVETGGAEFQKTQKELLRSRGISERVVAALSLDQDGNFTTNSPGLIGHLLGIFSSAPKEVAEAERQDQLRGYAVRRVQNRVNIRPVPASRLIDIIYTDPSPKRAATIANSYADAFVASNLDKRFEASAYAKIFLEDQIKQLKLRLEEAEKDLIKFAEEENMVHTSDRVSNAETNLSAANTALGQLISTRIRDEETWMQVENATTIDVPQLLTNSVIDGLRTQRNDLRRVYEEKLEILKPSYPTMMEISNKIAEINRQLAKEVVTIRRSLRAAYKSSMKQEQQMRAHIDDLRAQVIELQKKSVRYGILQREVETNRNLYNNLLQRHKEVDVASGVGTNNVFIVDRALAPESPSHPRVMIILAGSLMLGLAFGFGGANLIELLDDRIRAPDEAEKASGLPILGLIPVTRFNEGLLGELANPRSGVAEAYRSLATSLQFSSDVGLPRTIVVTSAEAQEGKSSTSVALARHFAVTGKRVLIIDADLRRPSLHIKLGHDNAFGLTNCLTGMATLHDVVQPTDIPNLWFMASGPLPPNAADILAGTHVFSLISLGLEIYDLIIFDSPPMLGLADAQLLGAAASATVFVVGAGDARRSILRGALRRLQMARAQTIGLVLTKFDAGTSGYGYGYGYGYSGGYDAGEEQADNARPAKKWRLPSFDSRDVRPNKSQIV